MAAPDLNANLPQMMDSPSYQAFAITPGAGDLANMTRAIYVGVSGNVTATMYDGVTSVTFVGMLAGQIYPIRCSKITAGPTNLIGLF